MPIEVAGRTRIPDGLTNQVLSEVKNVNSLSLTQQLRDFMQYAGQNGLRLDLYVRPGTTLSGPLMQAIRSGAINLRFYSMRKKVTAAELMAQLSADARYVAERAEEEGARAKRADKWRRAEASLVEELQSAGLAVKSAWDLVNTSARYPLALPILLEHLQRPYPAKVREGIARALAVPEAKFAWDRLMRLYQDEREALPKDGLAVALAAIADDETIDNLIALAKDKRNGPSRLLLLSALERSSDPRAQTTLVELENDPELKKEIEVILRRMKKGRRRAGASSGDL